MNPASKIPVTILTGFLGAGKTTLLNRILRENHGKRIAVIENEYGEIGIDQGLVINADEEVFEMSNGCICCTVRGDLIRVLGNLVKRRDRFDYVLVETTGLADPGPVAQTFFVDDEVRSEFSLDGIVTLVDAKYIYDQLHRSKESVEQIAFADVIVLNKCDLVPSGEVDDIESRLRDMNRMARIYRCENGDVPISSVLDLAAFDLDEVMARRPTFLEPEYPFEWSGVFHLDPGEYTVELVDGPDPEMSLVLVPEQGLSDSELRTGAEWCVRRYAEPAKPLMPGEEIPWGEHVLLQLGNPGTKVFRLHVARPACIGLYTQHTAAEFDLKLCRAEGPALTLGAGARAPQPLRAPRAVLPAPRGSVVQPAGERLWVAQHEHDDEVGSVAIEVEGDVSPEALNAWLGELLRARGPDLYRLKGFLSIAGDARRYVFQGVHMLVDGKPADPWGEAPRRNQLVLIGRHLDRASLWEGFRACLV